MMIRVITLVFLFMVMSEAYVVRREISANPPNFLESFQKNMEQFQRCIDQSLASSVKQVNEKQLQPVLDVVGDSLNRVSKAFDDLTATTKSFKFDIGE